jgi:hypothetical protein
MTHDMSENQLSPEQMKRALVEAVREWKDRHNEIARHLRIQPAVPRNVIVLRYIGGYKHADWAEPNPDELLKVMKDIINRPSFVKRDGGGPSGWDAALRAGKLDMLWESLVLDRRAPYAPLFTDVERANVAQAIANSYRLFAGLEPLPADG